MNANMRTIEQIKSLAPEQSNGSVVKIDGDLWYKIENYDSIPPFFMTITSSSDIWNFIWSSGALSAGRKDASFAIFPYYTSDKIDDFKNQAGPFTEIKIKAADSTYYWEPFATTPSFKVKRNIYKNSAGSHIIFEEINTELNLTFKQEWTSSAKYGLVRIARIINNGPDSQQIQILDGCRNIMPACATVQLQNDLNQYKSILLLAMNGCFNSVIVEYRSLYESFVIGQYLVQNPDLVPVYKDHLQFLRYHFTQLVGNSMPEWDKIHDDYLNKYGQEFAENYGWTKIKIPNKKDRKIGTLAKECNLENSFTVLYKYSSSYVHSSAFSVSTRTDLSQIKIFFQAAMHFIESEITDYLRESKLPAKDAVIMRNILVFLYQYFEKLDKI